MITIFHQNHPNLVFLVLHQTEIVYTCTACDKISSMDHDDDGDDDTDCDCVCSLLINDSFQKDGKVSKAHHHKQEQHHQGNELSHSVGPNTVGSQSAAAICK